MEVSSFALLSLGLGLGILHAFDADHIMAVTSLANRKRLGASVYTYALRWAIGHGGILLCIALLLITFDFRLPESWTVGAERMVGVILILAGISILWGFKRSSWQLHVHTHDDGAKHVHLTDSHGRHHDHTPVMVGVIHGVAGSAPALALIPTTLQHAWLGIMYVMIFSIGVLAAMLTFGFSLGKTQQVLLHRWPRLFALSKLLIAFLALGLGSHWLISA